MNSLAATLEPAIAPFASPDTIGVLVSDVMVAGGAVVMGSVVMPHTYVSGELSLLQAVASGATVMHAAWGVEHRLPAGDALLAPLSQQVQALERLAVAKALEVTHGNKVAAAKMLGVSRAKLYQRLP